MTKTLTKIAGSIILPILLLTSPVKAEEVKTLQYNDNCIATYTREKGKELNILKMECDNGISMVNPSTENLNKLYNREIKDSIAPYVDENIVNRYNKLDIESDNSNNYKSNKIGVW